MLAFCSLSFWPLSFGMLVQVAQMFPMLIGSQIVLVFSTYFIFCSLLYYNQITSIKSGAFNDLTSLKYKIPSSFPWCNLQNINMLSQCSLWYSTILCEMWLWNEGVCHDCPQFHQYQQSKQSSLTLKSLTRIKTRTYNVANPGTGLGQAQALFWWY